MLAVLGEAFSFAGLSAVAVAFFEVCALATGFGFSTGFVFSAGLDFTFSTAAEAFGADLDGLAWETFLGLS